MTLIVKPHSDFAPNTIAEAAKVNDQLNMIYADHNGSIVDANIAPTANIQQSKVLNLTANLATITSNVSTLTTALNSALSTVTNDVGEPSSAVVGEVELYTPILVAANILGTDNYLHLEQDFLLFITTGSTCQLRYYYGGTLFFDPTITNNSGVYKTFVAAHVDITIKARAANNSQYAIGRIFLQTTDANFYLGGVGQNQFLNSTLIAVDSTANQSLQTNVIWNQSGNSISGIGCSSWMVK